MPVHDIQLLHNTTVERFSREKTLFLGTVSPVEAHGPHFPLGADMLQSEGLLKLLAERFSKAHPDWEVVMLPPVCFGADLLPLPGSLVMPAEAMQQFIYHYLENFAWHGFQHVYLMDFHGAERHSLAIENALAAIHRKYNVRYLHGFGLLAKSLFQPKTVKKMLVEEGGLSWEQAMRDQHGGALETSLGLHLFPEVMNGLHTDLPDVHIAPYTPLGEEGSRQLSALERVPVAGLAAKVINEYFGWRKICEEELGYVGSPSKATAALGEKLVGLISDQMMEDLERELGKPAAEDPRSGSGYQGLGDIGPNTVVSHVFGTYRGPRRMSSEREGGPLPAPEQPEKSGPRIHELKYLHNTTMEAFDREKTLFLGTISPIEAHGPHFPLGSDVMQSEAFLKTLAKRFAKERPDWDIVMLPPLCVGADVLPHPGTLVMPVEFMQQFIYHYLENFAWHGFEHVYLMGFHGGVRHSVAIENALRKIHKKYGVRYLYGLGLVGKALFLNGAVHQLLSEIGGLTEEQMKWDQHGGALETSLGLYLFPEAMNGKHNGLPDLHLMDYTPMGPPLAEFIRGLKLKGATEILGHVANTVNEYFGWRRICEEELGYVGSPALASRKLGKAIADLISDQMMTDLRRELERPKTMDPLTDSAYTLVQEIGPHSLASLLFGTYRGPRRLSPHRDKHPLKDQAVATGRTRPKSKTVRVTY